MSVKNPRLSESQIKIARKIMNGASPYRAFQGLNATRDLSSLLGSARLLSTKHDFNFDFGYKDDVDFYDLYQIYKRNGVARALIHKTISKSWETMPSFLIGEGEDDYSGIIDPISKHFERIRFWQKLVETDRRSLVGEYAGVIFQLADGQDFDQPVTSNSIGTAGLINLIPAWEGQLQISQWNQNKESPHYGEPEMMTYTESSVDSDQGKYRAFQLHADRVYIWSQDRTTFNDSSLESVYNALTDMVKIRGSSAESFWKNAKSNPILQANDDVDFTQLAQMLGTDVEGLPDALDNILADWTKGFDQSLILQGMEAKTLPINLPANGDSYYKIAAQEVAAAWEIPEKTLFGSQTGERASTEDAAAWNRRNMGRRNQLIIPNIMDIIERLVKFGVMPKADWGLDWEDLTGATDEQRVEKAGAMADINSKMLASGGVVFSDDEIREVVHFGALEDSDPLDDVDDLFDEDDPV